MDLFPLDTFAYEFPGKEIWVEFEIPADATDLFLDYDDPDGSTRFIVALF